MTSTTKPGLYALTPQAHATVMAALNFYADALRGFPVHPRTVRDIATNGQTLKALSSAEVCRLAEELNNPGLGFGQAARLLAKTSEDTLPPDPEGKNDERAHSADVAIRAFAAETRMDTANEDDETIFGDLQCDLMHWADRQGIDFDFVLAGARENYREETTA